MFTYKLSAFIENVTGHFYLSVQWHHLMFLNLENNTDETRRK